MLKNLDDISQYGDFVYNHDVYFYSKIVVKFRSVDKYIPMVEYAWNEESKERFMNLRKAVVKSLVLGFTDNPEDESIITLDELLSIMKADTKSVVTIGESETVPYAIAGSNFYLGLNPYSSAYSYNNVLAKFGDVKVKIDNAHLTYDNSNYLDTMRYSINRFLEDNPDVICMDNITYPLRPLFKIVESNLDWFEESTMMWD